MVHVDAITLTTLHSTFYLGKVEVENNKGDQKDQQLNLMYVHRYIMHSIDACSVFTLAVHVSLYTLSTGT